MSNDMQQDFVGINEIAEMAGVSRQAVANWRARFSGFPSPIAELKSGPVFRRSQIRAWLHARRFPMTHVISTINLKGGVGKTHTTVALAEVYSAAMQKKVLVIDIDPQTNATLMLIGEEKWAKLNENDHTLARLFKDALDPDNPAFDFERTLQKGVSDVRSAHSIDLLPSSLDLIDVQDRLAGVSSGKFHAITPIEILHRVVKRVIDEYDIILIDCPPNLGIITLNGLRISNGYIIPTIPDILSTYGIPQIVKRVKMFSDAIGTPIEPLGVVVSKYREQSAVHRTTPQRLRATNDAPVFSTTIPEASNIARVAEYIPSKRTPIQKYERNWQIYNNLAEEILEAIEK